MRNKGGKWAAFEGLAGALVPKERKTRKPARLGKVPEAVTQDQAEAYLDALGLFYIRLPDSLMRTVFATPGIPIYVKMEVSDCLKGLPDLTILKDGRFLSIELKREGGTMSEAQRDVQRSIGTVVCFSFEQFREVLDGWLKTF